MNRGGWNLPVSRMPFLDSAASSGGKATPPGRARHIKETTIVAKKPSKKTAAAVDNDVARKIWLAGVGAYGRSFN